LYGLSILKIYLFGISFAILMYPMDTTARAIAARVREARKVAQLSQEDIARKLGLTDGGYGHYERGRQPFTLEMIFKLAIILGRPVTYFLGLDSGLAEDEDRVLALYREARAAGLGPMVISVLEGIALH
jgi:transcriptional regulator with XRE-family HTH domain